MERRIVSLRHLEWCAEPLCCRELIAINSETRPWLLNIPSCRLFFGDKTTVIAQALGVAVDHTERWWGRLLKYYSRSQIFSAKESIAPAFKRGSYEYRLKRDLVRQLRRTVGRNICSVCGSRRSANLDWRTFDMAVSYSRNGGSYRQVLTCGDDCSSVLSRGNQKLFREYQDLQLIEKKEIKQWRKGAKILKEIRTLLNQQQSPGAYRSQETA